MTLATDAGLRLLLDRAAIQDVLLRYARGVDRRDFELVASCFTPDASYEGALARGCIADALAALRGQTSRYETTMHFLGNQVIELAGDGARSETYALAFHRLREGGMLTVAIRYVDELVRHGEHWLIRARVVHREWERHDAA